MFLNKIKWKLAIATKGSSISRSKYLGKSYVKFFSVNTLGNPPTGLNQNPESFFGDKVSGVSVQVLNAAPNSLLKPDTRHLYFTLELN